MIERIRMPIQLKAIKKLARLEMIKEGYIVFEAADGDTPFHLMGIGPTNILMVWVQPYGRPLKHTAIRLGFPKPFDCIIQIWEKVSDKGWVKTTI